MSVAKIISMHKFRNSLEANYQIIKNILIQIFEENIIRYALLIFFSGQLL